MKRVYKNSDKQSESSDAELNNNRSIIIEFYLFDNESMSRKA